MTKTNNFESDLYQDFIFDHSILYSEEKKGYIEKLMVDFFDEENVEFNLFHGDEGNRFQLSLVDKEQDDNKLSLGVLESISSFDENVNYVDLMSQELKDFYTVYQDSSIYVGQFGFGVKNYNGVQKIMLKTNIEEMVERVEEFGYSVERGKLLIENKRVNNLDGESLLEIDDKIFEDENSKEKGPVLSKKLGEMPSSNSLGFSNYFNLALFLTVDVLAIFIGIYLLMR